LTSAALGVTGRIPSEYSGSGSSAERQEANYGADSADKPSSIRSAGRSIRGLPLSAQIGGAVAIALLAGLFVIGSGLRFYDGHSGRAWLCLGASVFILLGLTFVTGAGA